MATLVHMMKQLEGRNAILQSAVRTQQFKERIERIRQFIEKDFLQDNESLAGIYRDISKKLAERGWFIAGSLYPHQYQPLAEALNEHKEEQVEEFLMEHVRGLVSDIKEVARSRWQKRAKVLADAFDAHVRGKYTLSVPVFLAQADGIAADLLGAHLFTKYKGPITEAARRASETYLQERPLATSFLDILFKESGLGLKTDERDRRLANPNLVISPLNRHGVLHGLDCDYATEANSLRGVALISFLEWVAQVVPVKEESLEAST